MRIGLIDVDGGKKFPNIALMKISAWHKNQGDTVEWYDALFTGHCDKVYLSKVFSFSPDYPYPIDADIIEKGGSGSALASTAVKILNAYFSADEIGTAIITENQLLP